MTRESNILRIIPITVIGSKSTKRILALLDDGSTATLINYDTAKEIGAKGTRTRIGLKGIGENESMTLNR